jgi:threonine synthase
MDIQVSSNFERLLYDAAGRDPVLVAAQMKAFEADKVLQLSQAQRAAMAQLFTSERAAPEQMVAAQRWAFDTCGEVLDPHTAIGLHAARTVADLGPDIPVVTLATAHPAKFGDAVAAAIGQRPHLPERVGDLFDREERYDRLSGDYDSIRDYVTTRATPRHG